jgi:hypothetical protein
VSESANDGKPSAGKPGPGKRGEDQQASDQPQPHEPRSKRPVVPKSEPKSESRSDWRNDGSAPRFTEPPSSPSGDGPGKSSDARQATASGSRKGKSTASRPGTSSGSRQSTSSSSRPGTSSGSRQGTSSGSRPGTASGGGDGARPDKSAKDPVADFQRWLMKAGARSMANQVADNVRRTIGQTKRDKGDVWDTATTESPPDEAPECQWCPVCQAARRIRESGPGLGDKLVNVGGVFASVVQDAFSVVEQAVKAQPPDDGQRDKAS